MRMLVLGAGLQGSACTYDLLQNPAITEVRLADKTVDDLPRFLQPYVGGERLKLITLDVKDAKAVREAMSGVKAPYGSMSSAGGAVMNIDGQARRST